MTAEADIVAPSMGARLAWPEDWFTVDWSSIWAARKLDPRTVVGVHPVKGDETRRRWRVHRSHFKMLGLEPPPLPYVRLSDGAERILYKYQHASFKFIRQRRGTLLLDEQRVGKSAPTMYAHEPADGPMFVFGPVAARAVWHEWAARRFGPCVEDMIAYDELLAGRPADRCSICTRVGVAPRIFGDARPSFMGLGGKKFMPEAALTYEPHVMFSTTAVAPTWWQMATKVPSLGTLVVDEVHLAGMQNRHNLTASGLRKLNTVAVRCVLLSGTPLINKVKGLWTMLDIATPAAFGAWQEYGIRYCAGRPGAHGWDYSGESNLEELKLRLQDVAIRRTWAEIRPELPPIQRSIEVVPMTDGERDEVEALAARIRFEAHSPKTKVGDMARLMRLYGERKARAAFTGALASLEGGYSCVVWTWHTDLADKLAEMFRSKGIVTHGPVHGKVLPKRREEILEAARADSGPRVLVAGIGALGTAVNLAWAPHEHMVELPWAPHHVSQAEMRCFDGSRSVACVYYVADTDSDQRLADSLVEKLRVQDKLGLKAGVGDVAEILGDVFQLEKGRSLDDLAELLMGDIG